MPFPSQKPRAVFTQSAPKHRRRGWAIFTLLVLAGAAFVLTRKPVPPPAVVVYTPHQARAAQSHVDAVRAALTEPPSAAHASPAAASQVVQHIPQKHGPDLVKLQLSQADLNAYFATEPHIKAMLTSHQVKAVQMLLAEPRSITVRATLVRGGHPYNIQIETVVRADPKTGLRVTATGAQVGRLPLPGALVTAQANKIAGQITGKMKGRLPLMLQDVRVQGDHLVLTGTARAVKRSPHSHGLSMINVTGPSFSRLTRISAPNSPI